jgi:hypothetical protein
MRTRSEGKVEAVDDGGSCSRPSTAACSHGEYDHPRSALHPWHEPPGQSRPPQLTTSTHILRQYLVEKVIRSRIYDSPYWSMSKRTLSSSSPLTTSCRGTLFRAQLCLAHRQRALAQVHRGHVREPEADRVHVPRAQAAAAPTRAGDYPRILAGGGVQVGAVLFTGIQDGGM